MSEIGLPRSSCVYETYIPDPLTGRQFAFGGDLAADIADAEAAVSKINEQAIRS